MHALEQIWRAYTRDPIGSLLTIVGVVLGSAALVFLASGLEGASHAMARTSQRASGDDVVRIDPERAPDGVVELFRLSDRDAVALRDKESLPTDRVTASVTLYKQKATVWEETMPVGVQSGGARWMRITGVDCCTVACSRFMTKASVAVWWVTTCGSDSSTASGRSTGPRSCSMGRRSCSGGWRVEASPSDGRWKRGGDVASGSQALRVEYDAGACRKGRSTQQANHASI